MQKYFLHIFMGLAVLMLVAIGLSLSAFRASTELPIHPPAHKERVQQDTPTDEIHEGVTKGEQGTLPPSKLKADTFVGTLETVNTGCFADGECFIEVDGRHVTALRGWSQDTVGSVQGVEGFGDLESYIGKQVEVYAQVTAENEYTLYGSEGFYIKLLDPKVPTQKPTTPTTGCVVGGCSAQLCVEAKDAGDMVTTCEYTEAYACYKNATCERQTTGECGWTETKTLTQCLMDAEANAPYQLQ